jgi:Rod binding domain-containing protein
MMDSSSSSSNGFGLAEKIARQLLHDSEDLDRSVRDFQETRTRGLQMQYDAYAAYEEEIKAIGYINEGLEIEDDDDVDHNMTKAARVEVGKRL